MSIVPAAHGGAVERVIPAGARALGVKVKPTLRLSMGYRDEQNRGRPVKTDHLRARGDHAGALAKFVEVYGAEPKKVDILLRPELNDCIDIRYRAFGGGQHGGGGMMKAIGSTNYALLDYMGGPDTLTVWNENGVEEVDISGADDPVARQLGVELAMTFRFGLPKVLSYGAVASISTRGKESIDTLWSKLREWYGLAAYLGAPVPVVTGQPLLVLKPSTMMAPRIQGKGDDARITGWSKAPVYVLDLVLTETLDEMVSRVMSQRQNTLAAGGAAAVLYGPSAAQEQRQLAAVEPAQMPEPDDYDFGDAEPVDGEVVPDDTPEPRADVHTEAAPPEATVGDQQAAAGPATPPAAAGPAPGSEPDVQDDPPATETSFPYPVAVIEAAMDAVVPHGQKQGRTLGALARGRGGHTWFQWALENPHEWTDQFFAQLRIVHAATWGVEA